MVLKSISETDISSNIIRHRPEIDGLRAFAVLAVIINHFNKNLLPGGYLGVDIFFVISGYVITSSLYGRPSKNFRDFISGFYERRIKRLVPALSVFVLITGIAICLFNPRPGVSLITGITSLFGLSNLYLLKQSTDYFDQSTSFNVFTHTWSLGVEEQFYIFFPFLLWFSGFVKKTKNGARNLFFAITILMVASLIAFLYLYQINQSAAYFLMPFRFWEMATGCLIFIGFQKRASVERLLENVPPSVVIASLIGVMYLPMSFASVSTVAVVVFSSVLIACLKQKTKAFKVFTHKKVVYVGLISYSLYLWHWGVLSVSRWTIGVHWWSVPFQIALMLGLAVASYRWIEMPFRRGEWLGRRWKTFLVCGGVLTVALVCLVALGKPLKGSFYIGKFKPDEFVYVQDGMECELSGNKSTTEPLNCIIGNYDENTIYVFGNSHASNLVKSLEIAGKDNGYNNVKYLTNAFDKQSGGGNWYSNQLGKNWYEDPRIDSILKRTSKKDLIVWSQSQTPQGDMGKTVLVVSQINYLSKLSKLTGVPILIVDDLPHFISDEEFWRSFILHRNGPVIHADEAKKIRSYHTELIRKNIAQIKNVYYFDPFSAVCEASICGATVEGELIYADSSPHFNKQGALILANPFSEVIKCIKQNQS